MESHSEITKNQFDAGNYFEEDDKNFVETVYDYDGNDITSILSCMVSPTSNLGIQKLNKSFYMIQPKSENIFRAVTPPVTSKDDYIIYFNHSKNKIGEDFYENLSKLKTMNNAFTFVGEKLSNIFHKLRIEFNIHDIQNLTFHFKNFFSTDCIDEILENILKSAKNATGYIFTPTLLAYFWAVSETKINYAEEKFSISICFHFPDEYDLIEDKIERYFNWLKETLVEKFSNIGKTLSSISYHMSMWDNIRVRNSQCLGVICTEECKLLLQGLPLIHVVPQGQHQIRQKHYQIANRICTYSANQLKVKLSLMTERIRPLECLMQKEIVAEFYKTVLNNFLEKNAENEEFCQKVMTFQGKINDDLSFNDYIWLFNEMMQQLLIPPDGDKELEEIFFVIRCCFAALEFVEENKVQSITDILQMLFLDMDSFLRGPENTNQFRCLVISSFQELCLVDKDCSVIAYRQNTFRWALVNFFKIAIIDILMINNNLEALEKVEYEKYQDKYYIIPESIEPEETVNKADDSINFEKPAEELISPKKNVVSENTFVAKCPDNQELQEIFQEYVRREFKENEQMLKKLLKESFQELRKQVKQLEAKLEDNEILYDGKISFYQAKVNKIQIKRDKLLSFYKCTAIRESLKLFKFLLEKKFKIEPSTIPEFLKALQKNQNLKNFENELKLQFYQNLGVFFGKLFGYYQKCNEEIHAPNIFNIAQLLFYQCNEKANSKS